MLGEGFDLSKLKIAAGFRSFIVQLGLSKFASARNQSVYEMLAATELPLSETYTIPFFVIGSA